ncbi:MAG: methyltransferase domain-containing protein [Candidatus Rokubacteria bacterium]|nr:methyltransferase domain-containing protein [Candidatus Rokubacteria bacterium]
MRRSTVLGRLPIRPSDFVVEIGAGPAPFMYTKLILDKYPLDNIERYGDILNVAPIIKADAVKLPLADKACDVLFVSHVLEHLDEPGRFIAEAKRCARWIYLEFPTARRELMYAWSFHRWLIEIESGTLVFYRNDIPQLFGDFFHAHYDFLLDRWSEERFEELNSYLYAATDDLACTISPTSAMEHVLERGARGDRKVNFPSEYGRAGTTGVAYSPGARLKLLAWALTPGTLIRARNRLRRKRNRSRRRRLGQALVARLLCQRCRTPALRLERGRAGEEIACTRCHQRYTATEGIFDFDL